MCLCIESESLRDSLMQNTLPDGRHYFVDGESIRLCNVLSNVEHEAREGMTVVIKSEKAPNRALEYLIVLASEVTTRCKV